jgi:HSF-type DNA-binding
VVISDMRAFSDTVLPQYFKHGNIQSFVRQLNMYVNFQSVIAVPICFFLHRKLMSAV